MRRHDQGWLALASALAGAGLIAVGLAGDGTRRAPELPTMPGLTEPAPLAALRMPPLPVAERVAPRMRDSAPRVHADPGRALGVLAALLRAEPFDDGQLTVAARALAHDLDAESAEWIRAVLGSERDPAELLAAAELLRACAPERAGSEPLPPLARVRLLDLAQDGTDPLGDVAARALAALGEATDARALLEQLLEPGGPRATRAARALPFARDPALATALVRALESTSDPAVLERAVLVLARLSPPSATREELAADLLRLARRAELDPALRRRVLAARAELAPEDTAELAGLRPEESTVAGTRALEEPDPQRVRARLEILLDATASPAARLAAAESVARAPSRHDDETCALARQTLGATLEQGTPDERRRALHALTTLRPDTEADRLVRCARFDPDPSVRAAGLIALRALDPGLQHQVLERVADADPEEAVRTLARHERAR